MVNALAGARISGVGRQQILSDGLLIVVFALLMIPAAQAKIEAEPVPWRAASSMSLYAILGFVGLPVFARGGGPAYFLTPTAGYIYGFIVAAFVTGMMVRVLNEHFAVDERGSRGVILRFLRVDVVAALAGVPFIYIFGVNHLALYYVLATEEANPWGQAWSSGAGIFIWFDIVKAAIAGALVSSAGMRREELSGNG